jgi:O-antigen/teichoic acid export membrane protein
VYGSFYRNAAQILIILSLARLVSTWAGNCLNTLLLTGRQNVVAALNVFSVITLLSLGPIFGRAYGATGIAVVSAAVIVIINLVAWTVTKVQVGVWTHATFRVSD